MYQLPTKTCYQCVGVWNVGGESTQSKSPRECIIAIANVFVLTAASPAEQGITPMHKQAKLGCSPTDAYFENFQKQHWALWELFLRIRWCKCLELQQWAPVLIAKWKQRQKYELLFKVRALIYEFQATLGKSTHRQNVRSSIKALFSSFLLETAGQLW